METKFSLVIPTRERHETLYYAIKSALSLERQDYEVIIADNCSSPETKEVVHAFNDKRLRYSRSESRLSMVENFERGLNLTTGEYICMIGDDDCIVPPLLDDIEAFFDLGISKIACWDRCVYFWPNSRENPNIFSSKMLPYHCELYSRPVLEASLNYYFNYQDLPSIYNSWISREIIDEVKKYNSQELKTSKFYPEGVISPDVFSSLQILKFSHNFLYFSIPFSISGISGFSNGIGGKTRNRDSSLFHKEMGKASLSDLYHPYLKVSQLDYSVHVGMLSDYIHFVETYFSKSENHRNIIENILISGIKCLLLNNEVDELKALQVLESNNIIIHSIDDVYNFHDNGFKQLFRIPNDKYFCLNISEHGVDNAYDASIFYQKMLSNLSQSDDYLI